MAMNVGTKIHCQPKFDIMQTSMHKNMLTLFCVLLLCDNNIFLLRVKSQTILAGMEIRETNLTGMRQNIVTSAFIKAKYSQVMATGS